MKTQIIFLFATLFVWAATSIPLQAQDSTKTEKKSKTIHGQHFIDKDGDGYNDNAPDHDGDGIPNGLDPDWQILKNEKGNKKKRRFVDLDGDGINDIKQTDSETNRDQNQRLREQKSGSSLDGEGKKGETARKKKQRGKN